MESKQPITNKVKSRFLPLCEAVAKGLEPEAKISDFSESGVLGSGSFGKVTLMTHNVTGAKYAIKSIDKRNKNNQDGKPYFRREVEIMYKAKHPNIVRLFSHFEDDQYCYFVMEYISKGNLYSILSKQTSKCFDAKVVASFMRDLISAVYYLHSMDPPIVHRDIKPENVLLAEDGRLKLTDFGWSNYMTENEVRVTYCGTPVYLAPEMIKEIGHDKSLDIWCIGVLMFELLTGNIPFPGNNMNTLAENIVRTKINWPKDIDFDAKNLISKILKPDPKDRISLPDMLKHPFFTKNVKNPLEYLILPSEVEEPIFLLSSDTPAMTKTNSKRKESKLNSGNETKKISNEKIQVSQNDYSNKDYNSNNATIVSNNYNNNTSNQKTQNTYISAYSDLSSNIKELYDKLKIDYENLTVSYNELVKSKSEISKKIDEFSYKENYFKQEKESFIRELDEKVNEKLHLQKTIAELNDKIMEKDKKYMNLNNLLNFLKDKNKKDESEIENLNDHLDMVIAQKDEEIKIYQDKIAELQKQNEGNIDQQFSSLRQSISGINDRLVVQNPNSSDEGFNEYRRKMESELKETKEYLTSEMDSLRKEMVKEREKFNSIVKSKDEEIKRHIEEKTSVKNNEAKKYNKFILKYDTLLKEKEIEVENLKNKITKLENIIMVNNYKR